MKGVGTIAKEQRAGKAAKVIVVQKKYRARQKVEPGLVVRRSLFSRLLGR